MGFRSRGELQAFVSGLAIPESRKEVVLLELEDHVFSDMAENEALGLTRDEAEARALEALGDPTSLAARLADVDSSFVLERGAALSIGMRLGGSFVLGVFASALAIEAFSRLSWYSRWPWAWFPEGTDFMWLQSVPTLLQVSIIAACVLGSAPWKLVSKLAAPPRDEWVVPLFVLPALAFPLLPVELESLLGWILSSTIELNHFCLLTIHLWIGYLLLFAALLLPGVVRRRRVPA